MRSIIGKVLRERYYIRQELGRGDFGITYLAEDLHLPDNPRCVVKRLIPQIDNQSLPANSLIWSEAQKRFVTEAITLQRLGKHPQIPELLAYFEENQELYLVQEFVDGKNLEQIVKKSLLSETEVIPLLQDALTILDFVHQQGTIHRDIKPANLIRQASDNKIALIDFGAVKNITQALAELQSGLAPTKILGTEGYMPPEQQEGNPNFTSDLYALGKTAIYALTGKHPGTLNLPTLELDKTPSKLPREATPSLTQISPRLSKVINKMVHPNHQERYQSAKEVLAELEREENFITLPPPFMVNSAPSLSPTFLPQPKPQPNLGKIVLWSMLILPFLGALLTIIIGLSKNQEKPFLPYVNNNYQIQIRYPETWSVQETEDPITGEIVVFSSPKESDSDIFQEKVFVTVQELATQVQTLDEYSSFVIEKQVKTKDASANFYIQKEDKLAEQPARVVVYSRQAGNIPLRQMEIFTFYNDQVYVITYVAERAKYSKFLKTVNKMVESFDFQ